MKKLLLFVALFLSACAPLQVSTPTPTLLPPTSTVEPTLTPIPFSEIDFEPLLIQPGDLPAGISAAQIRDSVTDDLSRVPKAERVIYQQLEKGDKSGGKIVV